MYAKEHLQGLTFDQHLTNVSITYDGPMSTNVEATEFVDVWPKILLQNVNIGPTYYCYQALDRGKGLINVFKPV